MAAKAKSKIEAKELLIAIEAFEQSYHIADYRAEIGRVDDEAIIDIHGAIVPSSDQRNPLDGKLARVSLICAQSYHTDPEEVQTDVPMLMTANLAKGIFQIMAYLPSSPFWALPEAIKSGRVSHVHADYHVSRGRVSKLSTLYFARPD